MSIWTIAWLLWGAIFFAIEIPAVRNKQPGDTLSEHVWKFLGRGENQTRWIQSRRIVFLAFWAWLSFHFISGWV